MRFLDTWSRTTKLSVELLLVQPAGVVHAENAAIARVLKTDFDIISFMDDDAIALPSWINLIKAQFNNNPTMAGLGGPDFIFEQPWTYHDIFVKTVGKVTWFGKVIGNHHHRSQGLREVDVLKGVNMSIRKKYLTLLDTNLQGSEPEKGNGVFWELDLCLAIKKMKGKLFFDPQLLIHHDSNHRHFIADHVIVSTAHNMSYVMLKHFHFTRKMIFIFYAIVVGNNNIKGLLKTSVELLRQRNLRPLKEWQLSMKGFCAGFMTGNRLS